MNKKKPMLYSECHQKHTHTCNCDMGKKSRYVYTYYVDFLTWLKYTMPIFIFRFSIYMYFKSYKKGRK